ncbi:hypothetical protein [Kribbella sp. CA-247076]|uniref:hypothetical protein n=1 Tax=Kribbella sp. CA-247076 TaxID=3239941 RepID=UPI003D8E6062
MTPVDHRRPPARTARSQHRSPSRSHKSPSRSQHKSPPRQRAETRQSTSHRPQRSHSAVGAAIVAAAAMVAVFAFILTRGSSTPPVEEGFRIGAAADGGSAPSAPGVAAKSSDPSPSVNTAKADRKPPVSSVPPKAKATATPNTGPATPAFKRGQWIVVMEKYPTDVGMDAEQLAKATAIKMITAGVPAKAMLVDGQYPGIANSSMQPVLDTWMVYLGPGTSAAAMGDLCATPKTQAAYSNTACPTFEPAVAPAS